MKKLAVVPLLFLLVSFPARLQAHISDPICLQDSISGDTFVIVPDIGGYAVTRRADGATRSGFGRIWRQDHILLLKSVNAAAVCDLSWQFGKARYAGDLEVFIRDSDLLNNKLCFE